MPSAQIQASSHREMNKPAINAFCTFVVRKSKARALMFILGPPLAPNEVER